jgi:hypothetical protein
MGYPEGWLRLPVSWFAHHLPGNHMHLWHILGAMYSYILRVSSLV